MTRRLSLQAIAVLAALREARGQWRYGLELSEATGLKSGSLYPILARLAERGMLEGKWVDSDLPGRPQRHAYRISGAGREALREAENFVVQSSRLASVPRREFADLLMPLRAR